MSTSQGIQAFIVTIPEPGAGALASLAVLALVLRRRIRQ
ncbi:MAG: PEP-CTERM sorting domain-containing protein [Nitrospira sp.]|nr:PEP-CTERM sorting domain-containing protein [Nitrospira sp.]